MFTKNIRQFSRCVIIARSNDKINKDIIQSCGTNERGYSNPPKSFLRDQNRHKSTQTTQTSDNNLSYLFHPGVVPLMDLTIGQLFEAAEKIWPNRECLVSLHQNVRLTYSQAYQRANKLAAGFKKLGLKKGDRIGLWGPNDTEWFIAFIAAVRAGLIMVGINPAYQQAELEFSLQKVQVKAIVAPDVFRRKNYAEMVLEAKTKCPNLEHIIIYSENHVRGTRRLSDVEGLATSAEVLAIFKEQNHISPYDGSNIQFTSGTTGKPKATFLNHRSLVNNSRQGAERFELLDKHHKICLNVPFFHAFGMIGLNSAWHAGSTLILPAPIFNPVNSLDAIVKEKCTAVFGTPTMWVNLIDVQQKVGAYINHITTGAIGGSPASPELHKRISYHFNFDTLKSVYGLTETTAISFQSLPNEKKELTETTVGHLSDHLEAMVVNENGSPIPMGTPGELWIRGYTTMIGYWEDEESTRKTLTADGWLKTGDQFTLKPNGYGQVVGRLKDMVIRGGENIFPKEIEDFLETHPAILEVHVIGVHCEVYGEEVCACVRLKNHAKLTKDELKNWCKGKIAHFKIPKYIQFRDAFPCTTSGKIQKYLLREELEAQKFVPAKPK